MSALQKSLTKADDCESFSSLRLKACSIKFSFCSYHPAKEQLLFETFFSSLPSSTYLGTIFCSSVCYPNVFLRQQKLFFLSDILGITHIFLCEFRLFIFSKAQVCFAFFYRHYNLFTNHSQSPTLLNPDRKNFLFSLFDVFLFKQFLEQKIELRSNTCLSVHLQQTLCCQMIKNVKF